MDTSNLTNRVQRSARRSKMLVMSGAVIMISAFAFLSNAVAGEFFERDGVAIDGYDPVAYFTEAKAVKGDKSFSTKYKESVFHFSSAKNRDAFAAEPEKYAPQYSGYCAYGVSQGAKAKIEGKNFTVHDGKLYLNYNDGVQATWLKDTDGYITTANKKWPELK
jgi:YHS domain-containing protein